MTYTVQISPSGVAHVTYGDDKKIYCSVHHTCAGGVSQAKERAEGIAKLLNHITKVNS